MLGIIIALVALSVGCLVGAIAMDYAYYKKLNKSNIQYIEYVKYWFSRKSEI